MMLDHLVLAVADPARSTAFYALAPLGIAHVLDYDGRAGHADLVGFGGRDRVDFWLTAGVAAPASVHVGFVADGRAAVDAFHAAALAAGGRDNGAPGPRPAYDPEYYAAYVLDPDGYNVEAVYKSWQHPE